MPMTITQLENIPTDPQKAISKTLAGATGIYYIIEKSGYRRWAWRGKLKRGTIWYPLGPATDGKLTKKFLGEEATRLKGLVDAGIDPRIHIVATTVKKVTLAEAWERYKDEYLSEVSPAYKRGQEALWKIHILKNFGHLTLDVLDSTVATQIIKPLVDRGKRTTANRLKSVLSKLWNWCEAEIPNNQLGLKNWVAKRKKYFVAPVERTLSEAEIREFMQGYKQSTAKHKNAVLFLLLTGSRQGLLHCWKDEWLKGNILEIPPRVLGAKLARHLVMGDFALKLSRSFHHPMTTASIRHAMDDILYYCNLKRVSPHTLRKTFASRALDWEEKKWEVDVLLNHKGTAIEQAYFQRDLKTLIPVAKRIEKKMLSLMK